MKSLTFLLALGLAALAGWFWFQQPEPRPAFPWYGVIAASYAGGFLIGRVFQTVAKTAAILAALVLGGLALLHYVVDTTKAKQSVQAGSTWVQDQTGRAKKHLLQLLPSGGAAWVGVFAGARRRRYDTPPTPQR
jgi:hypothetical protein